MPRPFHSQTLSLRAFLPPSHTSCDALEQPFCPSRPFASSRRGKVPTGRTGRAGWGGEEEISVADWLGRGEACGYACGTESTGSVDESVEGLCGEVREGAKGSMKMMYIWISL